MKTASNSANGIAIDGKPANRAKSRFWFEGPEGEDALVGDALYFIQQGDHGPIKIGMAINVHARLLGMQTAHYAQLTLLAVRPGGRKRELAYHVKFAEHRLRGEWFSPAPEILAEIARLHRVHQGRAS